ncbi:MAG: preprotein translocase subunit SecG [Bacteroidia bacterium]|nr:preprotein translocase subunit SecG [Bacteroidia bacterium]MCX7764461.1 preprotein translocase subunit SecG [Bacteroidia bacterium]MDW8057057.1 preprotein translocase subunit SecG [Bacteroidia bacterium]
MGFLLGVLIFLLVVDALLLTLLVLIQQGKGGGLATDIQGVAQASQILGVRHAADFAEKATWTLFGGLVVLTLLIHAVHSSMKGGEIKTRTAGMVETLPPTQSQPAPTPSQPPAQPSSK